MTDPKSTSPASLRAADIESAAARAAAKELADGTGPAAAARAAIAVADRVMAGLALNPESGEVVAGAVCAPGCGWCCHQVVGVTVAEEEMVEQAVSALDAEARDRLARRTREAEARLSRLPMEQWQGARVPCPALEDARCVIHASRPLPCRAVLSTDAEICRRWLEGDDVKIPLLAVPRRVYSLAQAGLAQALAAHGIPPGPTPLAETLAMILG